MSKLRSEAGDEPHPAARREQALERLARLLPGGSPGRAIAVRSAAVIEVRTAAMSCPQCGGEYRILEHTRAPSGARRVDVACRRCSVPRTLWFRIVEWDVN
ncbi:MAG TPA: hypothetical protein VFT22_33915 [Kofleriaceae bacterium]|nr:hypothetical protein [Kofleriaceae bacterium]